MATSMQFGDLLFQFTDRFTPAWTDQHSRSPFDGSFWTPVPQEAGFRPLGGIGFKGPDNKGYTDPNGKQWALCVADATDPASGRMPALAAPTSYLEIWTDRHTGAHTDGTCWRPIPPPHYVACGDIFAAGHHQAYAPPTTAVWCVREDLVEPGKIGEGIWWFIQPTVHNPYAFSAFEIDTPVSFNDRDRGLGLFAANTFIGHNPNQVQDSDSKVYVLKVPMPVEVFGEPDAPVLEDRTGPDLTTPSTLDHIVTVPFTAIKDDKMELDAQVRSSPFYTIRRFAYYSLVLFGNNQTSLMQPKTFSVTVGITRIDSETFAQDTAITTGYEAGIELGKGNFKFTGKASASVTKTLGFATSTSVQEMVSATLTNELRIAPKKAAASWVLTYSLRLFRANGSMVDDRPLNFKINGTFVDSEFPPPRLQAHDASRPQ